MKVLPVSGYPDPAFLEGGGERPGIEVLPKPFGPETLLIKVRQVLETRPQAA